MILDPDVNFFHLRVRINSVLINAEKTEGFPYTLAFLPRKAYDDRITLILKMFQEGMII